MLSIKHVYYVSVYSKWLILSFMMMNTNLCVFRATRCSLVLNNSDLNTLKYETRYFDEKEFFWKWQLILQWKDQFRKKWFRRRNCGESRAQATIKFHSFIFFSHGHIQKCPIWERVEILLGSQFRFDSGNRIKISSKRPLALIIFELNRIISGQSNLLIYFNTLFNTFELLLFLFMHLLK